MRHHKPPSYLNDYHCSLTLPTEHWCNLVQYSDLLEPNKQTITHITQVVESVSYTEAAQNPGWVAAMQKEIEALNANNTWSLVPLPKGKKAIGSKWVYKVKLKADGCVERLKARLVAKGFTDALLP